MEVPVLPSLITEIAMEVPVARAVINTIVGSLLKNLIFILKDLSLIKDAEKLISILSTIKDAEEKQIKNKPISVWLRELKDAIYDAEDVLDTWALKIQQHNQKEAANIVSRSLPSSLNHKKIRFRPKMAKQIQKVIRSFDEIAGQQKFHLNTGVVLHSESEYNKQTETCLVTYELHIYGAEENTMKVMDILVNTFINQDDVSICPILGMGGLGKTTLAQSVYNDEKVKRHFELRKWVCVSEPCDVKRVLEAIIGTSIPGTLEAVHLEVEDILWQKRYLLLLDDVWNENQDEWNKLKSFMKGGVKGSSVVLTTCSFIVASITSAQPDDDCFSLFKNYALGDRGEEQHPKLVAIGKQTAKKYKGVPLVAKSLGSFLRFKTEEKQWESVRDRNPEFK